jgi:hypothetical protein
MAQVSIDTVLHVQDFGLERLDEDRAIVGFAQKAEARLVRWLDFATLNDQLAYLCRIQKVSAAQLAGFTEGKTLPDEFVQHSKRPEAPKRYFSSPAQEFRILDYVQVQRLVGRNWIGRCPSCVAANRDRSGDNLAISVDEPRKYICWAGCTKVMIRNAVGRPIPEKRSAL